MRRKEKFVRDPLVEIQYLKNELESLTKRLMALRESNAKLFAILESAGIIAQSDGKKVVIVPSSDPWGYADTIYNIKEVK